MSTTASQLPLVPVLRAGADYVSLERLELAAHRDGRPLALVSQANAGLVRRDLKRDAERARILRRVPLPRMLEICGEAGERFLADALPLAADGPAQSPEDYVASLSATSGLPYALCRANMRKIHAVLAQMPAVLGGLTRGLDPALLGAGQGDERGVPLSFVPRTDSLGVVLPSNSPGVHSSWLPAVALRTPLTLKPGREEPWTPLRIVRAFLAAGCPREAFGFYPTDHEGAAAILEGCGRSLLFVDSSRYAHDPRVEIHGPGRSKVLLGPDEAERWEEHLDVIVRSIADNGGRSCINASSVFVTAHADEVADALAQRLARLEPRPPEAEDASLAAFASPAFAEAIERRIAEGLAAGGAEDVTARYRRGPRAVTLGGASFLLPTILRCRSLQHPLANTEFLFPFASVVEVAADELPACLGPSLVVTAITRDAALVERLLAARHVERLNLGPVPTSRVRWDQPHEGNLFESLYARRALQRAEAW